MEVFEQLVIILSEDAYLLQNKGKFLGSLGISRATVDPWVRLFDMGHCKPYDIIKMILSEWITAIKDSATIAELRRILGTCDFHRLSNKLKKLEENHPEPITIPGLECLTENDGLINNKKASNPYQRIERVNLPKFEKSEQVKYGDDATPSTSRASNFVPAQFSPSTSNSSSSFAVPFGFGKVVSNFTGRDEELQKLGEYFHSEKCPVVLLSGLGGIGKTQLATKFASDTSMNLFRRIFKRTKSLVVKSFVAGETPQTTQQSVLQLCQHLNIATTDGNQKPLHIQAILQNIMQKLQTSKKLYRWLIVIDNVDEMHDEFKIVAQTLLSFGPKVFLLITSRRKDIFKVFELTHFPISTLKVENGVSFVKNCLEYRNNYYDNIVKNLCEMLGNFPLALGQAMAYIKERQIESLKGSSYSVIEYVMELSNKETAGLDQDREFADYPVATMGVWNMTFDRLQNSHGIEGKLALEILNVISFVNPDKIEATFVLKLFPVFYKTEKTLSEIESGLELLLKYSLISTSDNLVSIHRLLQLAVRERISVINSVEFKRFWLSTVPQKWEPAELDHVFKIWEHSSRFPELNEVRASAVYELVQNSYDFGIMFTPYELVKECSKLLLHLYGPESLQYLRMVKHIPFDMDLEYFLINGDFLDDVDRLKSAYDKLTLLVGECHADTLSTGAQITGRLLISDREEERLELCYSLHESFSKCEGEQNRSIIRAKIAVAGCFRELGESTYAVELWREVLEWQRLNLGELHNDTLDTLEKIADCHYYCEYYFNAMEEYQELLPLQEKLYGVGHYDILTTREKLGHSLEKLGEVEQALKIWEELSSVCEKSEVPEGCYDFTSISRKKVAKLRGKLNRQRRLKK